MSDSQSLSLKQARATLLEMVARLLLKELDEDARVALSHPDLARVFEELSPGFMAYVGRGPWTQAQQDMADADFCHLFLLNKGTAPYASAWVGDDPAVAGAAVTELSERWCERLSLKIEAGPWGNIPRDHVAVLIGLIAHASLTPGPHSEGLIADILQRGLGRWIFQFINAVESATNNPVYRGAVLLLADLLDQAEAV
jgi:TorA maturation chaperone TorD